MLAAANFQCLIQDIFVFICFVKGLLFCLFFVLSKLHLMSMIKLLQQIQVTFLINNSSNCFYIPQYNKFSSVQKTNSNCLTCLKRASRKGSIYAPLRRTTYATYDLGCRMKAKSGEVLFRLFLRPTSVPRSILFIFLYKIDLSTEVGQVYISL